MEEIKEAAVPYPEEAEPVQQDVLDAVEAMSLGKDERSYAEAMLDKANEIAKKYQATLELVESVRLENSEEIVKIVDSVSELINSGKKSFQALDEMKKRFVTEIESANESVKKAQQAFEEVSDDYDYFIGSLSEMRFWNYVLFGVSFSAIAYLFFTR